jgi:alginate O-acetyltransferase complex protein AlgI
LKDAALNLHAARPEPRPGRTLHRRQHPEGALFHLTKPSKPQGCAGCRWSKPRPLMLFSSYVFLLLFLPVTLGVFLWLGKRGQRETALGWLVVASLFFYGWWNPAYLILIAGSMILNYALGRWLRARRDHPGPLLLLGVTANLGVLGYYKYAGFFVTNVNQLLGAGWTVPAIVLPLGISFFTFTQIAYLLDCCREDAPQGGFWEYWLFVTFFPHLLAGPIVHHRELMPQFTRPDVFQVNWENVAAGFTMFTVGLFKKVVLADNLARFAIPVFSAAERSVPLSLVEGWGGTLAYTFQLYFDFSGYSDMAIGLSLLFGIRLPRNFNSPYKARSIIDFWRRWHITLSRFLRDYLYIPLGGNRLGETRRLVNLFLTMLLGGLWHGAGWTFVAWGALHGLALVVNHGWHALRGAPRAGAQSSAARHALAVAGTFLVVVAGWVLFRAESFTAALKLYAAMAGSNGLGLAKYSANDLARWDHGFGFIVAGALIVWCLPNSQQFMRRHRPTLEPPEPADEEARPRWLVHSFTLGWCVLMGVLAAYAIIGISRGGEFLYFNF